MRAALIYQPAQLRPLVADRLSALVEVPGPSGGDDDEQTRARYGTRRERPPVLDREWRPFLLVEVVERATGIEPA